MSGGIVFDLWVLGFIAAWAGLVALICLFMRHANRNTPIDYEKEWPEFKIAREAHVRRLK